jgi:ADP-heptose:LPS heptosyltransferase
VPSRCLVVHPGALGDVLLALPALAHLAALVPGSRRVLAASPRLGALLEHAGVVEQATDLDGLGLHHVFESEPDPEGLVRLGGYDVVVSWLGAGDATYRRHLERLARRVVVARAVPPPGSRVHAARHLLDTLAPLGSPPDAVRVVRLEPRDAERAWARGWLEARGLGPGEAVILHPGAGSPAKAWPGFGRLASRLRARGRPVVVVGGPVDAAAVARTVTEGTVPESVVGQDLSLPCLAALFRSAGALVGNDSGLSHLAAAVGCPTVALFGPTDPRVWAPIGERVVVLGGEAPTAANPWGGLSTDRVEAALERLARHAGIPAGRG